MTTLCLADLCEPQAPATNVVPLDAVRRILHDEEIIRAALVKRCGYSTTQEFIQANEVARRARDAGSSLEASIKAGVAVAEQLQVERAFRDGDGPRAA